MVAQLRRPNKAKMPKPRNRDLGTPVNQSWFDSLGLLLGLCFGLGLASLRGILLFHLLGDLFALLGAGRLALLALGVEFLVRAQQLDIRHLRGIALANVAARDARVSPLRSP